MGPTFFKRLVIITALRHSAGQVKYAGLVSNLVVKDEGPDEAESQLGVAVDDLIGTNVHHSDLHTDNSQSQSQ